jgi:hypothetical protein
LIKVSITWQYYRLFPTPITQWFLSIYLVLLIIWSLAALGTTVFACWPVDAFWDVLEGPKGGCLDRNINTYVSSSINLVTDLVLVIIPLVTLRHLRLPGRQKWILLTVFGVGFFACITSAIRLWIIHDMSRSDPVEQSSMKPPAFPPFSGNPLGPTS